MSAHDKPPAALSRHRSNASHITTASGVADSTISFNTFATGITEESLRLSQFPPPPTSIPGSEGTASPARSHFSPTPPITPSSRGLPFPFPSNAYNTTAPLALRGRQGLGRAVDSSSGPPVAYSHPSLTNVNSEQIPPPPSSPNSTSHYDRPSQAQKRGVKAHVPSSPRSTNFFSPHDWHEGSSSISVDPAEERMLSTSFITGLLSSSGGSTISAENIGVPYTSRNAHEHPPLALDNGSVISEMTYPPPSRIIQEPAPPPRESSPEYSRYPPNSYHHLSADFGGRSTSASNHTYGGISTIESYEGDATVVQNNPGVSRKVSLMGMTPATLRHVPSESSMPSNKSPSIMNSLVPLNLAHSPPSGMPDDSRKGVHANGVPPAPPSASFRAYRERRQSTQSTRTTKSQAPSFISRVSQSSAVLRMKMTIDRLRVKPLPPVPTIPNMTVLQEDDHRRMENTVPLPELIGRADRLNAMLDSGQYPHRSGSSFLQYQSDENKLEGFDDRAAGYQIEGVAHMSGLRQSARGRKRQSVNGISAFLPVDGDSGVPSPSKAKAFNPFARMSRTNKIRLSIGLFVLAVLILVAIVVGVVVGQKHRTRRLSCPESLSGNSCDLNATCVCTSSSSSCDPLAQNLVDLTPTMNQLFKANLSISTTAAALFAVQGTPTDNDCTSQAVVVDVAPGLDSQTSPNRTAWAQAALLWSMVQSQNSSAVMSLQEFIHNARWSSLALADGPVANDSTDFTMTTLGFTFDFANQILSEPQVSFVHDGQPSSAQIAQIGSTASAALDRMYSFASASSTQRATALDEYWRSTLGQDPAQLATFISNIRTSSILLPFDAVASPGSKPISDLLTNSSATPFPPPLACYPGLSDGQMELLSSIETTVFGLSPPSQQTSFETSCYADRPIYGVLDVLRLRLPFYDSSHNLSRQAAVLNGDLSPRAVIWSGQVLSALPDADAPNVTATDPRQYGTLNHLNHVLYNFFTSIPDIKIAQAFAEYILSSPVLPPSNDSLLAQSLDTIPLVEVAMFGSVTPNDVSSVASSFAKPNGALFFGTDQSEALRNWAITGAQSSVVWTDSAIAQQVVHDNSFTDTAFNSVWNPAFTFFSLNH